MKLIIDLDQDIDEIFYNDFPTIREIEEARERFDGLISRALKEQILLGKPPKSIPVNS